MNAILTNKQYDILKWVALVLLPALGTLYFGLAGIWGFMIHRILPSVKGLPVLYY